MGDVARQLEEASHDVFEASRTQRSRKTSSRAGLAELVMGEERESRVGAADVACEDHAASLACGADR